MSSFTEFRTISSLLCVSALTLASACGSPGNADDDATTASGGSGEPSGSTGGSGTGGSGTGGSGTGGSGTGSSGGDGGDGGAGGGAGGGGSVGSGGAAGSGGSASTVDSDGCPITLEGFATVSGNGQEGTSGGAGGPVVVVTNQADLEQYAGSAEPYVIRVQGKITMVPKGTEVHVTSDKTIVGIGASGEIDQGGFFLGTGVHNVIIRNLKIGNTRVPEDTDGKTYDFDGVQMDTAHHVWIDHCHFRNGNDGLIDSRKDTSFLTVSWNILSDHNKAFGIGWTDNVTAEMTIHHNILRDLNQRNPSVDNVLRAHLYNNWMQNLAAYGNYARGGTNMVLENSVFEDVNNPHYYDTGSLVAIGNAYVSTTGQKESSGSSFSFFEPSDFYQYSLDPVGDVKTRLTQCAGPRGTLGN